MSQLTKRLATLLAAIVLGTTLLATGANAAVQTTGVVAMQAIPADSGLTVTEDEGRPERDGIHHRRLPAAERGALTSRRQQRHHARAEAEDHGSVQLRPTGDDQAGDDQAGDDQAGDDQAGDDRPATQPYALTVGEQAPRIGACSAHLRRENVVVALTSSHQARVPVGDDDHRGTRRHVVVARHGQLIGTGRGHRDDFADARQR
jgi:hypothetical protein